MSVSPVLCKFWWLYGGVNGDLLQEGLCHTQVCCTQSPCHCSRSLLTCTSRGDTQTQFWLSLCGVSGSWCAQGLFEPSEHLCRVRSLILNAILPLLPSFWDFSFALGQIAQLCPTLCNPRDYTVHGSLQARILEWIFSRGSSQPRDRTQVSLFAGRFFTS